MSYKLVTIGRENAGKTCLLNSLSKGTFMDSYTTIGIAKVDPFTVKIHDKEFEITGYDTAGAERYFRSQAPIYFKNSQLCVLVYSINDKESFNELDKYYSIMTDHCDCKDYVLFVVGTKYDLIKEDQSAREVTEEEGNMYANRKGAMFIEVSSKDQYNISNLKDLLADGIENSNINPHIQDIKPIEDKGCC